jgi:hypothetical protein
MCLHHQLINSAQLSIIVRADLLRLDIRHFDRPSILVVRIRVRYENSQRLELSILDSIKYCQAIGSVNGKYLSKEAARSPYFWYACRK